MLTQDELGRVRVVLVGARNPNNIGAAARAMQDFGFRDLRLVNEYKVALETAVSAIGAAEVLRDAVDAPSVAAAVAGCSLVVGTTAVGERGMEHRLLGLVEAAEEMLAELRRTHVPKGERHGAPGRGDTPTHCDDEAVAMSGAPGSGAGSAETQIPFGDDNKKSQSSGAQVALLFGSEKTGLTNDALSHCDWLLTVPMHQPEGARHLSMNLGQAVAVCLWELVRGEGALAAHMSDEGPRAKAEEVERVVEMLREAMRETEYNRRFPASCDENTVRRLVHRMRLNGKDAQAWMGILRQVLWKVRGGGGPA